MVRWCVEKRTPMVVDSRKMAAATASRAAGGQSAATVSAGRDFFITIGVNQASTAPAAKSASSSGSHQLRVHVVDVGLDDGDLVVGGVGDARRRTPATTRKRLGRSSSSRSPAPQPTPRTRIGGMTP